MVFFPCDHPVSLLSRAWLVPDTFLSTWHALARVTSQQPLKAYWCHPRFVDEVETRGASGGHTAGVW